MNFSAEEISSDGAVLLLEKMERQEKLIRYFSKCIPDSRDALRVVHTVEKMLKQRVFMLVQAYEDCNDVTQLGNDPLFKDVLQGDMVSQPTLSRLENSLNKQSIFDICYAWIDRYVSSLQGRDQVIIDIDCTDDPTHGNQQFTLFNGFYGQFMYNELFFHDGDTGQIILPVLRPGNSHSNKWYVSILKRIVRKIRATYPDMRIYIRADSGFSCPAFYALADECGLLFAIGQGSNSVLKDKIQGEYKAVDMLFARQRHKRQCFKSHEYQAKTWHKAHGCISKIESTGRGMNVRHIITNIEGSSRDI